MQVTHALKGDTEGYQKRPMLRSFFSFVVSFELFTFFFQGAEDLKPPAAMLLLATVAVVLSAGLRGMPL